MSKDTVYIKVRVHTGFAGGVHNEDHTYPREDWERLTKNEQEDYLDECCQTALSNRIEVNASAYDSEEEADEDD